MSLQAEPIFDVPELTAQVANAAFPKGNIYLQLRSDNGLNLTAYGAGEDKCPKCAGDHTE
jgi:hypothetical protein